MLSQKDKGAERRKRQEEVQRAEELGVEGPKKKVPKVSLNLHLKTSHSHPVLLFNRSYSITMLRSHCFDHNASYTYVSSLRPAADN